MISALFEEINESNESCDNAENQLIGLCKALSKSHFKDNVELYIKLQDNKYSENDAHTIKYIIGLLKEIDNAKSQSEHSSDLKKSNDELSQKISSLNLVIAEKDNQIEILENNYNNAMAQNEEAEKAILSLNEKLFEINLKKENILKSAPAPVLYSKDLKYKFTSVCKVIYIENQDKYMLKRLADINEIGEITLFKPISDMPRTFENRQILHMNKGGSYSEGIIGIWDWNVTNNNYDPTKDFVDTNRNIYYNPISAIVTGFTMDELKAKLKSGITVDENSSRYIFIANNEYGSYYGLLIEIGKFTISSKILTIKSDVACLPKYGILLSDIIETDELKLYRSLNIDSFICYEQMQNTNEIVRDIVVKRASWQTFKDMGTTNKEWQSAKDFLSSLPVSDLCSEISEKCKCSLTDAAEYLDCFIKSADKYLMGNGEEYKALENAIKNSPELFDKCKELLRCEWESENKPKIQSAEEKLLALQSEIQERQRSLDSINKDLKQKQSIAEAVEKKVIDRISNAQKNAADFICKMGFVLPFSPKQVSSNSCNFVIPGKPCELTNSLEITNIKDWLDVCGENFEIAGVSIDFCDKLALFVCAACKEKIPLILTGPNGRNIADAFSCSVFGKSAAYANCTENFDIECIQQITNSAENVFVIDNAFSNKWLILIPF